MSKHKYPSIFKWRLLFLFAFNIFRTSSFENWEHHSNIPQFKLGHIRSSSTFKLIMRKRKYFMDFKGNRTMLYGYGKRTRIFLKSLNSNLVSFFIPLALVKYEIITAYYYIS